MLRISAALMAWNFKRYGTASQPIHKSHLNSITGEYGCARKFKYEQDAPPDERATVGGKAAAGTAAHETIARALNNPEMRTHLLSGGKSSPAMVARVFELEYAREVGGREALWFGKEANDNGQAALAERVVMVCGVLDSLASYVDTVELVEAGFIVPLGTFWLSGHVDIVYRPKANPRRIALADWKTGQTKPLPIELDHGWEAGVYSAAVARGVFIPRDQIECEPSGDGGGQTVASLGSHTVQRASRYLAERDVMEKALIEIAEDWRTDGATRPAHDFHTVSFGEFPSEIYQVHAHDLVPYKKSGTKEVKRAEDLAFHGYARPVKAHRYEAGQLRGPGWLPVQLSEYDLPRLEARIRTVVGMIRMGFFVDNVGANCLHCSYASDCLTAGYGLRGDESKKLERALRVLGDDPFNDGLDNIDG